MCVGYKPMENQLIICLAAVEDQIKVKPVYQTFKGWNMSTRGVRNIEKLPSEAKIYIQAIEKFIEVKISSISTSPERKDTILIEDPFK